MFQSIVSALRARNWSTKVKGADGRYVDNGIQPLVDELATLFEELSSQPIQITQPLQIENHSGQAAIQIRNPGGDARAVQFTTADGVETSFGAGLGNQGIVANELVPVPFYFVPAESIAKMGTQGRQGGAYTETPGEAYEQTYPQRDGDTGGRGPLPGNVPDGVGGGTVGHGYNIYTPGIGPSLSTQVQTGGGGGSLGTFPGGVENQVGGGGSPVKRRVGLTWMGPWFGFRRDYPWTPPNKGIGQTLGSGFTGSKTIVTAASFNDDTCVLTVTTETWNFVNGVLQA